MKLGAEHAAGADLLVVLVVMGGQLKIRFQLGAGRLAGLAIDKPFIFTEAQKSRYARHIMLPEVGEKGQAKSRLMRMLSRFLDLEIPYLDIPGSPVHEDPLHPITSAGRESGARRKTRLARRCFFYGA